MPNLRDVKFEDLKKREYVLVKKIVSAVDTVDEESFEEDIVGNLRTLRGILHNLDDELEEVREEIEYRKQEVPRDRW